MIFVSTGGYNTLPAWQTSELMKHAGILNVELSGGQHDSMQITYLRKLSKSINFNLHNYFPPPKEPFVLNLASLNSEIAEKSIEHITNTLNLCSELGLNAYSFHAGFLVDPKVSELGKKILSQRMYPRKEATNLFFDRLYKLSERSTCLGVNLFVENNVLSKSVYSEFNNNPLLMVDSDESLHFAKLLPNNVKILLDVAHLKVSAGTLNFDKVEFLKLLNPWIGAYHLSDNDGNVDSNSPMDEYSWFWPYLKSNLDYYTVEVYSSDTQLLFNQVQLTASMLNQYA
ncbi:sugar phosphate isomerase/epimerase [bacterium]|nr:sugar phosphate isomerase/epimerase [bacterium]